MSKEIDWSKAPEGATHYSVCNGMFYRATGQNLEYWSSTASKWREAGRIEEYTSLVQRYSNWNGTGLPPVGTVCEHQGKADDNEWLPVKILAHTVSHSQDVAVFQYDDIVSFSSARYFRPIRTPEQIAAEERDKAVTEMMRDIGANGVYIERLAMERMYDAGYRKTEAAK